MRTMSYNNGKRQWESKPESGSEQDDNKPLNTPVLNSLKNSLILIIATLASASIMWENTSIVLES